MVSDHSWWRPALQKVCERPPSLPTSGVLSNTMLDALSRTALPDLPWERIGI